MAASNDPALLRPERVNARLRRRRKAFSFSLQRLLKSEIFTAVAAEVVFDVTPSCCSLTL